MTTINKYYMATSVKEAYELNQKKNNAVIAGNLWLRLCNRQIDTAIDISNLNLDYINEYDDRFEIGSMCSLRTLECHEGLNAYTQGAAKEALKSIVGIQFRNMATVGGSIHSLFGFSDVLTLFLSLNAELTYYNAGTISLSDYAQLKPGSRDILTQITVYKEKGYFVYKSLRNSATDFPVITDAISYYPDKNIYVIAIGARPARAFRYEIERNDDFNIEDTALLLAKNIKTETNNRASKEYRSHLISVLTARALGELEAKI